MLDAREEGRAKIEGKNFPKERRLLTATDYRQVFQSNKKMRYRQVLMLARYNELDYARLGLAVAKRKIRSAVARNQFKRVVRESFRLRQQEITGFDVVVLALDKAGTLSKKELASQLDILWSQLINK